MPSSRLVLFLALPLLAGCEADMVAPDGEAGAVVPAVVRNCVGWTASGLGVAWSDIAVTSHNSLPEGDIVMMTTGGKRVRCLTDIDGQLAELVQLPG